MVKCLKPGKVVVILSGKYAGKKAVIVKVNENANDKHKFPHAVVVGVERPPRKVVRAMDEKKINKKTQMKVFTKVMNLQHFMPTRLGIPFFFYILDTLLSMISALFLRREWRLLRRRLPLRPLLRPSRRGRNSCN